MIQRQHHFSVDGTWEQQQALVPWMILIFYWRKFENCTLSEYRGSCCGRCSVKVLVQWFLLAQKAFPMWSCLTFVNVYVCKNIEPWRKMLNFLLKLLYEWKQLIVSYPLISELLLFPLCLFNKSYGGYFACQPCSSFQERTNMKHRTVNCVYRSTHWERIYVCLATTNFTVSEVICKVFLFCRLVICQCLNQRTLGCSVAVAVTLWLWFRSHLLRFRAGSQRS